MAAKKTTGLKARPKARAKKKKPAPLSSEDIADMMAQAIRPHKSKRVKSPRGKA